MEAEPEGRPHRRLLRAYRDHRVACRAPARRTSASRRSRQGRCTGREQGADVKVQEIVADFGIEKKPIRILLASDLASEGLNLHYLSHKLIHFDIPWALLKFQQRNGRIDRYGQEREPHVWYLVGHPKQEKIRGDLRILERLIERDNAARENIGDPSVFMGTNIEEQQEDVVAEAIESGESAEKFDADMDARARAADTSDEEQFAALEAFFGAAQPEAPAAAATAAETTQESRPTAFATCFEFVSAALERVQKRKPDLRFEIDRMDRVVDADHPGGDFRERTSLGATVAGGAAEIHAARGRTGRWPDTPHRQPRPHERQHPAGRGWGRRTVGRSSSTSGTSTRSSTGSRTACPACSVAAARRSRASSGWNRTRRPSSSTASCRT